MAGLEDRLHQGLARYRLTLPDSARAQLLDYLALLMRWSRAYNLTAVHEPYAMVDQLLLDSLVALPYLPAGNVVDVGSGGGLPGLPLAIGRPAQTFYLLDSNGKKTRFLNQVVLELRLPNVIVVQSRAEHYQPAEAHDVVISRAFAALSDMVRLTEHMLAQSGQWLAWKGGSVQQEIGQLSPTYTIEEVIPLQVPWAGGQRSLVRIRRARSRRAD